MYLDDGIGIWSQRLNKATQANQPALFLDRDGVIVEEVHFLRRPQDAVLCPGVADAIAEVNSAGLPVIVVTNQSGIARGHLGWAEFAAVQEEIVSQLQSGGARLDAVFACAYHGDGSPPYDIADHEWRKPRPGMFLRALHLLSVDLPRSIVVGDRVSDLEAGRRAGLNAGMLVMSGYGRTQLDTFAKQTDLWKQNGFDAQKAECPAEAIRLALRSMSSRQNASSRR